MLLIARTLNVKDTGETIISPVSGGVDIPNWINNKGFIGISDPIKDTVMSYNQAVNRALLLYVLSKNVEFSSVYEYYYLNADLNHNNHDNQKSHWIADFETSLKSIPYKVKKTYRTKYNETIVLISIIEDTDENSSWFTSVTDTADIDVSGSFMYHYEYHNGKNEYRKKQLLKIISSDTIKSMNWCSTISGNNYSKISSSDETVYSLKRLSPIYNDYGKTNDDMIFSKNEYGLWNSLIDTYFQALTLFESNSVVVENTTRQITHENNGAYTDKNQDISRLVMRTIISCSLKTLSLKNNNLYADWEIIEK